MRKIFKSVITLTLLLGMAWCVFARGQSEDTEEKLIVIITPDQTNTFFKAEADAADARAKALGYATLVLDHQDDVTKQAEYFDLAISKKAAAIILDHAGPDASIPAIQKARDAGIPSFLIDRELNKIDLAISQIIPNNYQGGTLAGEEFVRLMGGSGKYVELFGNPTSSNPHIRSQGFHDVIDQYPGMAIVAQEVANWQMDEAYADMLQIIQAHPAVDSSTSAHPLQHQLACTVFQVPAAWSEAETASTQRTVIPDPGADIDPAVKQQILDITPSGTHGAYVNLINGKAYVILVARAPSRDELDEAAARGVSLDARPVALDAFAFLVHTDNPASSLTMDRLQEVYSGKITQWHELGVDYPGSITAYQRNRNSGSQELMEKLVMQGTPMVNTPELITGSMLGPYNVIGGNRWTGEGGDPGGLGYTVYFYARFMFPHNKVKMIAVNGVYPDEQTIFKKEYPLRKAKKIKQAGIILFCLMFNPDCPCIKIIYYNFKGINFLFGFHTPYLPGNRDRVINKIFKITFLLNNIPDLIKHILLCFINFTIRCSV